MKEATYSKNGEEPSMKAFRRDKEKYAERIKEENKRIQKDKILDEEEDEEKEEEDEYAEYSKKKR